MATLVFKKEEEKEEGKLGRGNFRTGPEDAIDAVGDRMFQMLLSLYSDTKTDVMCIVFACTGSVSTRRQIDLHGLET